MSRTLQLTFKTFSILHYQTYFVCVDHMPKVKGAMSLYSIYSRLTNHIISYRFAIKVSASVTEPFHNCESARNRP